MNTRIFSCLLIACSLFTFATAMSAQAYEGFGRDPAKFNKALATLKVDSVIPELFEGDNGFYNAWCTSFLAPDGKPPVKTAAMDEELNEFQMLYDRWTCTYSPQRISDGDPKTAWCEGAAGSGIGETVIVHIDVTKPVLIWSGFGYSADYFHKNARPRQVKVSVLVADSKAFAQTASIYMRLKVLAQTTLELKDVNDFQDLTLPKLPIKIDESNAGSTFIAIRIMSVYPGSKYQDTLISEVVNRLSDR